MYYNVFLQDSQLKQNLTYKYKNVDDLEFPKAETFVKLTKKCEKRES